MPTCIKCKNWTITDNILKVGRCTVRGILIESCGGIILQSPKKLIVCQHYKIKIK